MYTYIYIYIYVYIHRYTHSTRAGLPGEAVHDLRDLAAARLAVSIEDMLLS